ncbi:hypothetical protein GQ55_7G005300 [Panicum hallii var. hallii]|uniref:Uncharacterized protein n=1 Tax=Panicum hallii var. hallii TaxID=1504633 RepID=A0A2T7CRJ2_9POAL|nr:hypothetical protein GQ55_7G005300 [Panicum hallii var. hallii]
MVVFSTREEPKAFAMLCLCLPVCMAFISLNLSKREYICNTWMRRSHILVQENRRFPLVAQSSTKWLSLGLAVQQSLKHM